jgi:hypothetical protein
MDYDVRFLVTIVTIITFIIIMINLNSDLYSPRT